MPGITWARRKFMILLLLITIIFVIFQFMATTILRESLRTAPEDSVVDWNVSLQVANQSMRFDRSRRYVIQDFAVRGAEWGKSPSGAVVCMATQGSVSFLSHLPTLGQHWQEWMSVSVFVPDVHFHVAHLFLNRLQKCFPGVLDKMAFHFVYPLSHLLNLLTLDRSQEHYDCESWDRDLWNWTQRFDSSKLLYPQNLLRNIARKNCLTEMVFVTDMDLIPVHGLAAKLNSFLASVTSCENCAYIVPAYEILENVTLPGNKTELLDLVQHKWAQSYRQVAYPPNQGATNITLWESLPGSENVEIAYPLKCFKFNYEPFYVVHDTAPLYDERFVGYGYTRNTQVYETQLAGYKFFVLNNVFIMHPGMAVDPFSSSKNRQKQVKYNLKLLWAKMKELKTKYGEDSSKLPCAANGNHMK